MLFAVYKLYVSLGHSQVLSSSHYPWREIYVTYVRSSLRKSTDTYTLKAPLALLDMKSAPFQKMRLSNDDL